MGGEADGDFVSHPEILLVVLEYGGGEGAVGAVEAGQVDAGHDGSDALGQAAAQRVLDLHADGLLGWIT